VKWLLALTLVALAATLSVTVNVVLLGYGGTSNDPVGQLSPVAYLLHPAQAHHDDHHARGADD
jgi:hypothetical protein